MSKEYNEKASKFLITKGKPDLRLWQRIQDLERGTYKDKIQAVALIFDNYTNVPAGSEISLYQSLRITHQRSSDGSTHSKSRGTLAPSAPIEVSQKLYPQIIHPLPIYACSVLTISSKCKRHWVLLNALPNRRREPPLGAS